MGLATLTVAIMLSVIYYQVPYLSPGSEVTAEKTPGEKIRRRLLKNNGWKVGQKVQLKAFSNGDTEALISYIRDVRVEDGTPATIKTLGKATCKVEVNVLNPTLKYTTVSQHKCQVSITVPYNKLTVPNNKFKRGDTVMIELAVPEQNSCLYGKRGYYVHYKDGYHHIQVACSGSDWRVLVPNSTLPGDGGNGQAMVVAKKVIRDIRGNDFVYNSGSFVVEGLKVGDGVRLKGILPVKNYGTIREINEEGKKFLVRYLGTDTGGKCSKCNGRGKTRWLRRKCTKCGGCGTNGFIHKWFPRKQIMFYTPVALHPEQIVELLILQ